METLFTHSVEENNCMKRTEEEREEEEESEDEDKEEEKCKMSHSAPHVMIQTPQISEFELFLFYLSDGSQTESAALLQQKLTWAPFFFYRTDKEVYHYVGQEIVIKEGLDSYAGMIWPAVSVTAFLSCGTFGFGSCIDCIDCIDNGVCCPQALALSSYLDTHREQLNLVDKAVLEIGAGTGLVSVVAALLGV